MILGRDMIELPPIPDLPATSHDGSRFSGWSVNHDVSVIPWLDQHIDWAGATVGLSGRREGQAWINVLSGKGAEIERHTEGQAMEDWTLVIFLTTLRDQGGLLVVGDAEPVEPVRGLCLAFPSGMPHRVTPLLDDVKRVSVGCLWSGRA